MLPSERRRLEKLNRSRRASLVFRKNPETGKRERFSKADIDSDKKTAKFFRDRNKRIDKEVKSITDKITDRRQKGGNLTEGLSNIASSISDNVNLGNALTVGGLLLKGTPIGSALSLLGLANTVGNFFNRDDRQGGMSFDEPRDFRNKKQVAEVANLQDNIIPTVTPTVTSRQGGMSFDAIPPSYLNANRVSSVFPQVVGSERVLTGTRDVSVPTGRQLQGGRPEIVIEQQPVFEDRDIVSSGLLQQISNELGQVGNVPIAEPRESDIAFAPANNITGLLGTQNIGQDFMQRYNVPQDFEPRIETSPVESDIFGFKKNITDRILKTVQKSLGDDYVLPPVSEVGDPVTLTNPVFGKVPEDYIPIFEVN
jgi:hypothetical protein